MRSAASLVAALVLLDFALTFENVWPGFLVAPSTAVSVELAALAAGLAAFRAGGWRPGRAAVAVIAAVLTLLAAVRYAAVTTAAVYGRPVHLYFDAAHLPNVFAMFAKVASPWLLALGTAGAVAVILAVHVVLRAALSGVVAGLERRAVRSVIGIAGAGALLAYAAGGSIVARERFATPVAAVVAAQVDRWRVASRADRRGQLLAPAADLGAGALAALEDADVVVVFVESYGAVAFDRDGVAAALAAPRAALAEAISATGRGVVSAFVESPTFAGASWLAHASFLAGIRVDNGGAYEALLASERDTLAQRFRGAGYRAVALMPGLRDAWPEGDFFGFDVRYDAAALDYRGPEFGWWQIPDQYTLAKLDALESQVADGVPRFVFFPTVSTHVPFRPTPPYQHDWARMTTERPFDAGALDARLAERPDWLDLTPAYVESLAYAYDTIAGYLERRAGDPLVLVLIGDHQPAASIAGPDARWDVPVHVVTAQAPVLDALERGGFSKGLTARDSSLAQMHRLGPMLLDAFGDSVAAQTSESSTHGSHHRVPGERP
jgi:hypothetical protein